MNKQIIVLNFTMDFGTQTKYNYWLELITLVLVTIDFGIADKAHCQVYNMDL
jgi:hypothetical protein